MTASVSVVVPVFNSAPTLETLVERISATLERSSVLFEIILVNDGSSDGSWDEVSRLAIHDSRIRGIDLMRNYGQHNALLAGIRKARYETVVTLDDDLQNPPEEITKLLDVIQPGLDVVYGVPRTNQRGRIRALATRITKWALKSAMGGEVAAKVGSFRAFRRELTAAFDDYSGPFVSIDVLLTWGTNRFGSVEVRNDPRTTGKSQYTVPMLVSHTLNLLTGFSAWPLRLASFVGFSFTVIGFMLLVFVVGRRIIEGGSVPGFPFLASVIVIFSGAQLFSLGLIGEYLARVHFRIMERPAYSIRGSTFAKEVENRGR